MERRHQLLILGVMPSVLAACAVFTPKDELRYSHTIHLVQDTSCLHCHGGIEKSETTEANYLPTHQQCDRCHKTADEKECTLCHSVPERAKRAPVTDRALLFSHKRHQDAAKGNCVRCHASIPGAQNPKESLGPAMEVCTDACHQQMMKDLRCDKCHQDLSRYTLEEVRYASHGAHFERRHGSVARSSRDTCAQCHERTFCSDCHSGAEIIEAGTKLMERATRNFIHPAPYEPIHSTDARVTPDKCQTCHRPAFCESCHAQNALSTVSGLRASEHPPGWNNPFSSSFHGLEARRSITTCAGCHDQGASSACVRCHQVGGPGGNPHPAGSVPRGNPRDNRMCRACHWSSQ